MFWFGVVTEFIVLAGFSIAYYRHGTFGGILAGDIYSGGILNILYFLYLQFGHGVHILSGYWLSKGTKKGIVLGLSLCLFEIVPFLVPNVPSNWFDPQGIGLRIMFAFLIFLIVLGRKERLNLRTENWRPWKKPF
ncbi:MAG: hypothetical protein ACREBI_05350 [Nitrosotalea sp.]